MTEAPVVTVAQGQLQGRIANTPSGKAYFSFQGVPYATPPLGSLRFKAPQPIEPWEGIRDATSEGNVSAQIDPFLTKQFIGDENCLFLNVYTPNIDGAFLPVMVFIHGGAFCFGSGNTDLYGPDFLVEKDVVVVTINYRLGALGFLSLNTPEVPGNAGMKDIALALKWVKENVENFGGNAGNLTVFGESAGGTAAAMLTASPLTKNLISKVIVQSGTPLFQHAFQKKPIENASNLAKALGCEAESVDEILDFLNATTVKDIVEASQKLNEIEDMMLNPFTLVVEKEFPGVEAVITEPLIDLLTSGRIAHVPTMVGTTALEVAFEKKSDDLKLLIPQELNIERQSAEAEAIAEKLKELYMKDGTSREFYQLQSDYYMNVATHRYVKYLLHSTNSPIFYYRFEYVGVLNLSPKIGGNSLGLNEAMHTDELGYLFGNDFQKSLEPTPQDVKMRERMVRLWTNFAKTGNPTPDENHYINVTWEPVAKDDLRYLTLGTELTLASNPDKEKMDFWDELYNKHFKIWDQSYSDASGHVVTSGHVETQVIITSETFENLVEVSNSTEVTDNLVIVEDAPQKENEPEIVDDTPQVVDDSPQIVDNTPQIVDNTPQIVDDSPQTVDDAPQVVDDIPQIVDDTPQIVDSTPQIVADTPQIVNDTPIKVESPKVHMNGNGVEKPKLRTSNEIKMVPSNGVAKDVIRANDPPEDDLPKNIGVNKFVNFFESLGGKK